MQATPATWRMLLDAGWAGAAALRRPLRRRGAAAASWPARCSAAAAPCGTCTAPRRRPSGPPCAGASGATAVRLGRPVANNAAVRAGRRPASRAPLGVPGELYIGGDGVARGYLGRPGLTAERFVPDPFRRAAGRAPVPHGRPRAAAGRTARWSSWAALDHQVKLRGFRIELGEIESALAAQPGVREAVAAVREDARGRRAAGGVRGPATAPRARRGCAARRALARAPAGLHGPRPPSCVLDALPADAQRQDGPPRAPRARRARGARPSAPAAQPGGEAVAGVWREVLGMDEVGVDDNFFDVGGHSLLVAQMQERCARRCGREVPAAGPVPLPHRGRPGRAPGGRPPTRGAPAPPPPPRPRRSQPSAASSRGGR